MRVEFHRPDDPDAVVASAMWSGGAIEVEAAEDAVRSSLERVYRSTPVVVDDASYRRQGTSGEVVVQPGTLAWFRAASFVRARAEAGMVARLVPGIAQGGFDPAAQYRDFDDSIERLASRSTRT